MFRTRYSDVSFEVYYLGIVTVCAIIGICCFVFGCEEGKECALYIDFSGTVYDTDIVGSDCDSDNSACYDVYVDARSGNGTRCTRKVADDVYRSTARRKEDNFPIGKQVNWFRRRHTNDCFSAGELHTLYIVGVVFMAFSAMLVVVPCCAIAYDYLKGRSCKFNLCKCCNNLFEWLERDDDIRRDPVSTNDKDRNGHMESIRA